MKDYNLSCCRDVLMALKKVKDHEKLLIDQVVLFATSATGEGTFSTSRRMKTGIRSKNEPRQIQQRLCNKHTQPC